MKPDLKADHGRLRILLTGQTSLHNGRLEHGNVGSAYFSLGLLSGLRRSFPNAEIRSTLQFTKSARERFRIEQLPLGFYDPQIDSDWGSEESNVNELVEQAVWADKTLHVDGDLFGPNADFVRPGRRQRGIYVLEKLLAANSKIHIIGASPGPFSEVDSEELDLLEAAERLVVREPQSFEELRKIRGFTNAEYLPCPSMLYPNFVISPKEVFRGALGVAPSIWNIVEGDIQLTARTWTNIVEMFVESMKFSEIILFSHANGFNPEAEPGGDNLTTGNDWEVVLSVADYLKRTIGVPVKLQGPLHHDRMASFISNLDALITGRVHATVAAHIQGVPAWMVDYSVGPRPMKTSGYMRIFDAGDRILSLNEGVIAPESLVSLNLKDWDLEREVLKEASSSAIRHSSLQFDQLIA